MGRALEVLDSAQALQNPTKLISSRAGLAGERKDGEILSAGELRAAQAHPEEYRDLVVKVAGYSAYFNSLDKGLQDQIIERTEHAL